MSQKFNVQIELDVVFDQDEETHDQAARALASSVHGSVEVELVDEAGPGAGWPVYRFTGELGSIAELVYGYHAGMLNETLESLTNNLRPVDTRVAG